MNAPPMTNEEEACPNCSGGRYSTRDAHGEMREYECNWCDGSGVVQRTTSAPPKEPT